MAKLEEQACFTYPELLQLINEYKHSFRRRKPMHMPNYLKCNDIVFKWGDYDNKYYLPTMHECRLESRMFHILKQNGIDPSKEIYYVTK